MKMHKYRALLGIVLLGLTLQPSWAQFYGRGGGGGRFRDGIEITDPERLKEQEIMEKALNPQFREDTFTFARLKYDLNIFERGSRFGGGRAWDDDSPNADLNLIYRLHDVTSLKVRPGLNFIDITTKDLANYPFVYLAGSGRVVFSDEQVHDLHEYLLHGGFLMADDFWGDDAWAHFAQQMKVVLPDHDPVELTLDHPIFHSVYEFKKLPQIPSVGTFFAYGQSFDPGFDYSDKGNDPHYYGIYDDKQRMMVLICHNNHYGDGWEHEGDDERYFDRFSNPMAYPMLLNIIVYTMSH